MRILVYSEKKAEIEKIGWHRGCQEIDYYRNGLYKSYRDRRNYLSSLVFTNIFEYSDDVVYFANTLPYTYTELNKDLIEFEKDEKKYNFITRKSLCTTLGGNIVDILTIASNEKNENISTRPGVVIMARVHPGETVGSWMMKGVIDFLTSNSEEAIQLRQNYVFKIVPMLNPDGVISGNYRTSFAGCDLNRRWNNPSEVLHPEIFAMKNAILKFAKTREIALICDLHGHSGLHNVFMYGNKMQDDPYACKVFPFIMSKINRSFHFGNCTFKLQKSKYGCARINLFHELNIPNIFTIEASFSGCKFGDSENTHFNTVTLKDIGKDLCRAIISYQNNHNFFNNELINSLCEKKIVCLNNSKSKLNITNFEESSEISKNKIVNDYLFIKECEDNEKEGKESDGSDSEPSVDNMNKEDLLKLLPNHTKKKRKGKKKKSVHTIKTVKLKTEEKSDKNEIVNKDKLVKIKNVNGIKENISVKDLVIPKAEKAVTNVKPIIINKSFEKEKVVPSDPKKREQETQTEEIFFKMFK